MHLVNSPKSNDNPQCIHVCTIVICLLYLYYAENMRKEFVSSLLRSNIH